MHREVRKMGVDEAIWVACFETLFKAYPDAAEKLNSFDGLGATPLHYAVLSANPVAVETLLLYGANPTAMKLPLGVALKKLGSEVAEEHTIMRAMSPALIAQFGGFNAIPDFVTDELDEWHDRRRKVVELMEPYMMELAELEFLAQNAP